MHVYSFLFSVFTVPLVAALSSPAPTTIEVTRTLGRAPPVTVVPTTRTKVITEIPSITVTKELFPLPGCSSMNAKSCCSGELFAVSATSVSLAGGGKLLEILCSGTVFSIDTHTETSIASLSTSTGAAAAFPTAFGKWDVLGLAAGAVAVGAMA